MICAQQQTCSKAGNDGLAACLAAAEMLISRRLHAGSYRDPAGS
jgi:hypothetical protein